MIVNTPRPTPELPPCGRLVFAAKKLLRDTLTPVQKQKSCTVRDSLMFNESFFNTTAFLRRPGSCVVLISSRVADVPRSSDMQETQAEISRFHAQLYRPDIDGLRAVAALAVVAVHAGWLRGGFFGVDIFFVISGFLISGIIIRALQDRQFSLLDFYARRVKRIFPALLVLLTTVSAFGWVVVPSVERRHLGQAVAVGAGFAENLWMYANHRQLSGPVDYLLGHLWTLGIEEQFYLVWPLLLTTMWRLLKQWLLRLIAVATVLSFGSYILADSLGRRLLPWNLFWELALGAILAYLQYAHSTGTWRAWIASLQRPSISHSLGTIGAAGIIVALVGPPWLDKWSTNYAWLPALGAFLVVVAGPEQWINRCLLAARPMVLIGLISYPLYLWHMALFMFAAILHGNVSVGEYGQIPVAWKVVVIAASLVLSYLTYKYIELPLRSSRNSGSIALLLCTAMAVCGIAAYFILS